MIKKLHLLALAFSLGLANLTAAPKALPSETKIWQAFGKKDWAAVETLVDQVTAGWGESARKTNASLTSIPSAKEARKYGKLNRVAIGLYLKGEALLKKGDKQGAIEAYINLSENFEYGQCYDAKGWWWQPAASARDRISELAPERLKKISLETPPLKAALKLPGKKGVCLTLRKSGRGNKEKNLPLVKATNAYWNYSWGAELVDGQPEDIEFMPMMWGAWGEKGFVKTLNTQVKPAIQSGKVKRVLGFNEPDKTDQANLSCAAALKYWPKLEALGVPLCSPACANPLSSLDEGKNQGRKTWMRDFMREADKRNYRIDYIGVHWYGGSSPRSFKQKMLEVYEAYGRRPLLISEFAVADWGAKAVAKNSHSKENVLKFMKDVIPWMEKQNWIAGYSWFSFGIDEPVGTSSALFDKKGNLTTLGKYYKSVSNENPEGNQAIR